MPKNTSRSINGGSCAEAEAADWCDVDGLIGARLRARRVGLGKTEWDLGYDMGISGPQVLAYETGVPNVIDPLGGSGVAYWQPIVERYGLNIEVVNPAYAQSYFFQSSGESVIRQFECKRQAECRLDEALLERW